MADRRRMINREIYTPGAESPLSTGGRSPEPGARISQAELDRRKRLAEERRLAEEAARLQREAFAEEVRGMGQQLIVADAIRVARGEAAPRTSFPSPFGGVNLHARASPGPFIPPGAIAERWLAQHDSTRRREEDDRPRERGSRGEDRPSDGGEEERRERRDEDGQ